MGAAILIRVFVSSTFADFAAEREVLEREVFPELARRALRLGAEVRKVDPRFGHLVEEATERVEEIPERLRAIDACRPFFVGFLGERYGWVPESLPPGLLAAHPWLGRHSGLSQTGRSLTEIEIEQGVLEQPAAAFASFFYLRDPGFLAAVPPALAGDFRESDPAARARLAALVQRVRASGRPVREGYAATWDPTTNQVAGLEALARQVLDDLWGAIAAHLVSQAAVAENRGRAVLDETLALRLPPPGPAQSLNPPAAAPPAIPAATAAMTAAPAEEPPSLDDTRPGWPSILPEPPTVQLAPPPPPVLPAPPAGLPPAPPPTAPAMPPSPLSATLVMPPPPVLAAPALAGPAPVPHATAPPVMPPGTAAPGPPPVAPPAGAPQIGGPPRPGAPAPAKRRSCLPWILVALALLLAMAAAGLWLLHHFGIDAQSVLSEFRPSSAEVTPAEPVAAGPVPAVPAESTSTIPEPGPPTEPTPTADAEAGLAPTVPPSAPTPAPKRERRPRERPAQPPAPAPEPAREAEPSEPAAETIPEPVAAPEIVPPRLLTAVKPIYPPAARRQQKQATVTVRVLVDETGSVTVAELAGPRAGLGFDDAALDAARRCRYRPGTQDGQPAPMWVQLKVEFKL